jgi:hypothetical protein
VFTHAPLRDYRYPVDAHGSPEDGRAGHPREPPYAPNGAPVTRYADAAYEHAPPAHAYGAEHYYDDRVRAPRRGEHSPPPLHTHGQMHAHSSWRTDGSASPEEPVHDRGAWTRRADHVPPEYGLSAERRRDMLV